jgi:hypothetical protein
MSDQGQTDFVRELGMAGVNYAAGLIERARAVEVALAHDFRESQTGCYQHGGFWLMARQGQTDRSEMQIS